MDQKQKDLSRNILN